MDTQDILSALAVGEDKDWEFKSAKGGIPGSLWDTYSAMANTDGGTIMLGIKEHQRQFEVQGLEDPKKTEKELWDLLNDRGKINQNLLTKNDLQIKMINGRSVLVMQVPPADYRQRPVYVGPDPFKGSFRRDGEGDYHCPESEVRRMFADQLDELPDARILAGFGLNDLDRRTLKEYRNRFASRSPDHPWLAETDRGLLQKIGGWRKNRATGQEGLTVAGMVMFGRQEAICDPHAIPSFQLDYRERLSDDPAVRWTDRITLDGSWPGNLFQFYQRVILRLTADLKIPFRLKPDLFRVDDTIIHEAIREALVNALIHADYSGEGGIVVEKSRDRFELSNPGSLLVSLDQLLQGGISVCRNKSLQKMFLMIGGGEQAGSGIDKIRKGWMSQHWRLPKITRRFHPDRVTFNLPMVTLLPESSLSHLQARLGTRFNSLSPTEVQALVTADVEGEVSNGRMREICDDHPADITQILQHLVSDGLLQQHGKKRGATYCLDGLAVRSTHLEGSSTHLEGSSTQIVGSTPHISSADTGPAINATELMAIAEPARRKGKLPAAEMQALILKLCEGRFLTSHELGTLLDRDPASLRQTHLRNLVLQSKLGLRYPSEPTHPDQAYKTGS